MRLRATIIVALVLLLIGLMLYPRPNPHISPAGLVSAALQTQQAPTVPVDEFRRRLAAGCTPILEGSDRIDGRDVWAVRLKIPPPDKYPWIEMWIDKRTHSIVAWKEWGRPGRRAKVLSQYPPPNSP